MFYLLFICLYLIVRSEFHFSESLCFIGISQFISSVHDLTRFCLTQVLNELNLQTHLRAVFVFCVPFYKPVFDIIYLIAIRFSIVDVSIFKRVSIYLFSIPVSLASGVEKQVHFTTMQRHFLKFLSSICYFHFHMGSDFVGQT